MTIDNVKPLEYTLSSTYNPQTRVVAHNPLPASPAVMHGNVLRAYRALAEAVLNNQPENALVKVLGLELKVKAGMDLS